MSVSCTHELKYHRGDFCAKCFVIESETTNSNINNDTLTTRSTSLSQSSSTATNTEKQQTKEDVCSEIDAMKKALQKHDDDDDDDVNDKEVKRRLVELQQQLKKLNEATKETATKKSDDGETHVTPVATDICAICKRDGAKHVCAACERTVHNHVMLCSVVMEDDVSITHVCVECHSKNVDLPNNTQPPMNAPSATMQIDLGDDEQNDDDKPLVASDSDDDDVVAEPLKMIDMSKVNFRTTVGERRTMLAGIISTQHNVLINNEATTNTIRNSFNMYEECFVAKSSSKQVLQVSLLPVKKPSQHDVNVSKTEKIWRMYGKPTPTTNINNDDEIQSDDNDNNNKISNVNNNNKTTQADANNDKNNNDNDESDVEDEPAIDDDLLDSAINSNLSLTTAIEMLNYIDNNKNNTTAAFDFINSTNLKQTSANRRSIMRALLDIPCEYCNRPELIFRDEKSRHEHREQCKQANNT